MTGRIARRWQWLVLLLAALPLVVYVAASVGASDAPASPRDPIVLDVTSSSDTSSPDATTSPSRKPTKPTPTRSTSKSPQVVLPSPDDLDDDDDDDGRDDDPDDDTDDD